jgi:hypothetical protein
VVTFRFYVVSTVAFFLALAVGVLVGSVLDGRIADGLQDRLDGVEASLDETVAAMDAKNVQIDELERYIEASAPFAVQDELNSTSTLVVAESGIDDAGVQDLVQRLRQSGSRVEGIVWLEPRWELAEADDLDVAAALASADGSDPAEVRAALWQQVLRAAGAPTATTTTTTSTTTTAVASTVPGASTTTLAPPTTATTTTAAARVASFDAAPLADLADAGLVRLQTIDADQPAEGGELLVVAVTGTASTLATPGAAAIELVRQSSEAGVPSVLAEVTAPARDGEQAERGTLIAGAFDDGSVQFSTVDDLELIAGRVATVLALADLREGTVGRFGYGPDVDGVLPAWQGP